MIHLDPCANGAILVTTPEAAWVARVHDGEAPELPEAFEDRDGAPCETSTQPPPGGE